MTVCFRPARRSDAREIARLFQISSEGCADYIWSLTAQPGQPLLDVGEMRYARGGVRSSYVKSRIAGTEQQLIGRAQSTEMR